MAKVRRAAFWRGRRVLVTGGAGFIGYALATQLAELEAKVIVLDIKRALPSYALVSQNVRGRIQYVRGSVASKKTVEDVLNSRRIQTVFHLAAEAIVGRAHKHPARTFESNAKGTWVLLEGVRKSSVKEVVIASSDKAYGSTSRLPYKEDAPLHGLNTYDASKSCTDLIAQAYAHAYDIPVVIARCGNVYGPGDTNWTRLIPDAFRSAERGRVLNVRSDGTFKRDFNYIDDIVEAYLLLAERFEKDISPGEAFNFGEGKPYTVLNVLRELSRVAPHVQYEILNTTRGEIHDQYLDASKARRRLRWRHRMSLRDGLKKTATWYAQYFGSV